MKPKSIWSVISGVVLFVLIALGFYFHQAIIDQITVWSYRPSSEVASIADRDQLSQGGRFIFYAGSPAIYDRQQFNEACGDHEPSKAILGCYNGQNIYIFDVTNDELNGIKEVTAAHELLHAAYQRLSSSDRSNVDNLIQQELNQLANNKSFQERIKVYQGLEPAVYMDEMHSVVGTEVADISSKLSDYYTRYFKDRTHIVALYSQYSSVFAKLQNDSAQLVAKLNNLAGEINTGTTTYNDSATQLSVDIDTFNKRAQTQGGFKTRDDFNQNRQILLDRIAALTKERNRLETLTSQYQDGIKKLDTMQAHLENLDSSIDSSLKPVPKVNTND